MDSEFLVNSELLKFSGEVNFSFHQNFRSHQNFTRNMSQSRHKTGILPRSSASSPMIATIPSSPVPTRSSGRERTPSHKTKKTDSPVPKQAAVSASHGKRVTVFWLLFRGRLIANVSAQPEAVARKAPKCALCGVQHRLRQACSSISSSWRRLEAALAPM